MASCKIDYKVRFLLYTEVLNYIYKEVTELNWKVQFSSKVPFFGELWTELSSLFGQVNLNWTEVHFFEWTWTKKIGE